MSPINSLSCPTFAKRPIEFQCVFSRLSHRLLAVLMARGGRRKLAHASNQGVLPFPGEQGRLCMRNDAAVALGRMGGKARAAGLSKKRRKEIAQKAAKSRWTA